MQQSSVSGLKLVPSLDLSDPGHVVSRHMKELVTRILTMDTPNADTKVTNIVIMKNSVMVTIDVLMYV